MNIMSIGSLVDILRIIQKSLIFYRFTYNRNKSIEIKALKDATHVLACSERDAHILINEVPEVEGKITVVPNCVNFKEYQSFHKDHPSYR